MLIAPEEIFPWDKVDAAKRYLSTVKPWWGRFLKNFVIVPVEVMPDTSGVLPYGSTTATDRDFRIYIDRLFALSVPLHYLAGAIEHELQRHTRDSWNRFGFLKDETWREEAVPALDLEINSTIDREQLNLDMDKIWGIVGDSALFTTRDLEYWNVTAPPGFDDDGWIPRVLGMDDGLSAEQYHQIMKKLLEELPPENEEEDDEGETDAEDDEAETDDDPQSDTESDSDEESESSESASGQDTESNEDEESDGESESEEDDNNSDGGDSNSGEGDDGDESDEGDSDSDEGDGSAEGSPEGLDNEGGSGDPNEKSEGNSETQESDANGEPTGSGTSGEPTSEEGSEGGDLQEGTAQPSDWDKAEAIRALQNSELGKMWQNSIENPNDPIDHPAWKPSDETPEYELPDKPSQGDISAAFEALSEDIGEFAEDLEAISFNALQAGDEPGDSLRIWRENYRRARGLNWDKQFMKLANAMLSSTQIKGQSDLSYSVRNPNQPAIGPILQGLLSYSPTIYVLQDVSGSMHEGKMAVSMSVFSDLCKKVLANYGDKVTWFSADTAIRDVGKTSRWNADVRQAWAYGFGGTQGFGEIIDKILRGKLVYKGKKYPKPDLLITSTDCLFPWVETKPKSSAKLLVINVGDLESAEMYLPEWLNRRREFIQVD